jgi:hypothetical protein
MAMSGLKHEWHRQDVPFNMERYWPRRGHLLSSNWWKWEDDLSSNWWKWENGQMLKYGGKRWRLAKSIWHSGKPPKAGKPTKPMKRDYPGKIILARVSKKVTSLFFP